MLRQAGVATRAQLAREGVPEAFVRSRLRSGEWEPVGRRVVRIAASAAGPEQQLWVAYLWAGRDAVVSHASAAWLWSLGPPPTRPSLTVRRGSCKSVPGALVHRLRMPVERSAFWKGMNCTDPLRTLVDLAAELPPAELDELLDRLIARRLASVAALQAEVQRSEGTGRAGPAALGRALRRRSFLGAPAPSVLESRLARLFAEAGVRPLAVEQRAGPGGCYRLDYVIGPKVAVEVDGYAYHWSPDQKSSDERRRNVLRLDGWTVLVYSWDDVEHSGGRIIDEVTRSMERPAG
ncbi:MAG: type IV toxin-antitoxin system AbiEi family antitoxin domain-containing protein [Actinomycetota bacterium]|nr:type IV toxin-antitoxin system AbiEi family antitoxin domain-containing protein [Actinomycetota bacterium]